MQPWQRCNCDSCRNGAHQLSMANLRQEQRALLAPRPPPRPVPHINLPLRPHFSQAPQTFQTNWRPLISYTTPRYPLFNNTLAPRYVSARQTMSVQPEPVRETEWQTQGDRDRGSEYTSAWLSQAPRVPPQAPQYVDGQSYFEDCTNYRAEEAALYNPYRTLSIQDSSTVHPLDILTMPCFPTVSNSAATNYGTAQATATNDDIPIMPTVQTNVDISQFEPVKREDWHRASLDFSVDDDDFAISPTSTYGPFTPSSENGFPLALRRASGDSNSDLETGGLDMFKDVGNVDLGFSSVPDLSSSIGSQFNGQLSQYGGLPFMGGSLAAPGAPAIQGSFRGIDGLPPSLPVLAPSIGKSDSGSVSHSVTKAEHHAPSESESDVGATTRDERDKYLLDMREEGFTYKEIKKMGGFTEAESTLRGRVRVLTKDRSERVRKPVWSEKDVCIDQLELPRQVHKLISNITDSPPPPRRGPRKSQPPQGRLLPLA